MELKLSKPNERWFYLVVLPLAVGIEWAFAATLDWTRYPRSEWVALFDLCVFMPFVYLQFFKGGLPFRSRLIRAAGISGIGLLASSFIVPESNRLVIDQLSSVRNAMLLLIIAFEAWVFWKLINLVFRKNADAKSLHREFAIPKWVAKLMILEAKFWKAVWSFFRRK